MKPSLPAILWNDWPALASWIGVPVTWVLYGVGLFLKGEQQVVHFFVPAIAATLVCVALAAWRIGRVYALFASGIDVAGQITCLWIVRDRGRLEFGSRVGEAEFESWTPVHKTARVLAFLEGQAVRVLLDPANPQHAIIRDLYVPAPATLLSRARR
ncbi:MAG: hypothetical protein AB1584_18385 [Pseudomonadota bacterium]